MHLFTVFLVYVISLMSLRDRKGVLNFSFYCISGASTVHARNLFKNCKFHEDPLVASALQFKSWDGDRSTTVPPIVKTVYLLCRKVVDCLDLISQYFSFVR